MDNNLMVEIVIRCDNIPKDIVDVLDEYIVQHSDGTLIATVPGDWDGFKDGTIMKILKTFNDAVYVAIAYFNSEGKVGVFGFDGVAVEGYPTVLRGMASTKYIKKRLVIVRKNANGSINAEGLVLNLKYSPPIIKVIDLYASDSDSIKTISTMTSKFLE